MALQIRRGTNPGWNNNYSNIVNGEPVILTDTNRFIVGRGPGIFTEFANSATIATAYNSSSNYIIGQICSYEGRIWKCLKNTSGTFDTTAWSLMPVADSILSSSEYLELANLMANAYDSTAEYFVGQFATYSGNVYECTTAIASGGEAWNANHWNLIGAAS